ncbi:hypothetical protein DFP72DRAFT_67407 [Ephemerocybe angulata]|uniref:Fungal-type protein kinase domain-containing protein n=1 Tax=Ephemerocybe angulata TaxID=980116 RepID=A0A8H6HF26_9AGAR|nr:hypothetical protein DFP72DRAFT_67407 [Tulosesus angulatus]
MAGFDFIKDLPTFFMFLFVLQRLKPADWGYLPHFGDVNRRDITPLEAEKLATEAAEKVRDETGREVPKDFIETRAKEIIKQDSIRTIDLSDMVITGKAAGATATFKGKKDDAIPTRFGLNGRSTGVKRGELSISVDEDGKKKPDQAVALKLSWAEINRTREKAIVDRARKAFEGKKFREGGDPSDYLPEILGEKVFAEFDTDIVRLAVLQNYEAERAKRPLAKRCPVLVLMPKYEPISFITSLSEATRVSLFIALIYCHAMLWSIGIEHGDISEGNLMYEESTYRPKLCDYDLAHIRGRDRPSGHSNTGTWAFMASDLLTLDAMDGKVRRLYRHDFESFIAVLVWVFLRYDKEKRIPNSLVDCWVQDDFDRCLTNRGRTYNLIEHGKITRPEWLTKVMWLELKSLVITFNNILTARRTAERELSGLETRRTRAGVDTSGLSTGGSKNGGAFFAPREDNTTTLWSKEDEEMLASLKRDIEEYDDLRFAKMAFSTIPLFRLGTSLGPYFDKEMKEHLKVTEDQATNVPT